MTSLGRCPLGQEASSLWAPSPRRARHGWRSGQSIRGWSKDGVKWSGWGSNGGSPAENSWAGRAKAGSSWGSLYLRVTGAVCCPSQRGGSWGCSVVSPHHIAWGWTVLGVGSGELRLHWASLGLSFPSVLQGPLFMFSG